MHTFFHAANIALKQFSKGRSSQPSRWANDGDFHTCFLTTEQHSWWHLELGANVRVSMVFMQHNNFENLEGYAILVGECVLSKASCIFCLFTLWFVVIIDQYHVFRIH